VSLPESSTEMPWAALRGASGTLRVHPARRPISALPTPLLAYRSMDMRAPLTRWRGDQDRPYRSLAGALISGADPATFRRTFEEGHTK
jgi:hypothetical protein